MLVSSGRGEGGLKQAPPPNGYTIIGKLALKKLIFLDFSFLDNNLKALNNGLKLDGGRKGGGGGKL